MTAFELIDGIFSRPQKGVAPNRRVITRDQRKYLEDLIGRDEDGGAVSQGPNGSLVWSPKGRFQYIVGEDVDTGKLSLMRLERIQPNASGRLF